MRAVPIELVKEGQVLAKELYKDDGSLLANRGLTLRNTLIDRFRQEGYSYLYIVDMYSAEEEDEVIHPQYIKRLTKTYKEFIALVRTLQNKSSNDLRDLGKVGMLMKEFNSIIRDIMIDISFTKPIFLNTVNIVGKDDHISTHSINTMMYAIALGMEHGLSKSVIEDYAIGVLLHDVGKIFFPDSIAKNRVDKTDAEMKAIIEGHSKKGYDFLTRYCDLNLKAKVISIQHHERWDGKGYPNGLKGEEIQLYSRIAAICDVFDAMTNDRLYRKAVPIHEAREYIMGAGGRHFDLELVKSFSKIIQPYPKGSFVRLTDGREGVVRAINKNFSASPLIDVYCEDLRSVTPYVVDLVKNINITIDRVIHKFSFE